MTYYEMVSHVKRMTTAEKLALLKVIADSLGEEGAAPARKSTLKSLYGALRPKDGVVPSDEELKEDYIKYLVEKYQ